MLLMSANTGGQHLSLRFPLRSSVLAKAPSMIEDGVRMFKSQLPTLDISFLP